MSAAIIQQARDVLAEWREEATAGRWIVDLDRGESFGAVDTPDVYSEDNADSVVLPAGTVAEHDIPLIVGTAGNPDLLDAIDAMFAEAQAALSDVEATGSGALSTLMHITGGGRHGNVIRAAKAIITADERMTS